MPKVAIATAVFLGAGCAAAAPKDPPPTVPGVMSAPPPAWIETRGGDRWLAFSDYCWTTTCIDSRPFDQRKDIPRIAVDAGEVVRFHLGFKPSKLWVERGDKTYPLRYLRVARWRVRGAGRFIELYALKTGFRAQYVARIRVR
ncbi:MAG: hypothetical protein ABR521_03970 [Gaiellaceae bacterium]